MLAPMDLTAQTFALNRYVYLPQILAAPARQFLYDYSCKLAASGRMKPGDDHVAGSPAAYGDPFMETLLDRLTPYMESVAGLELYPTYAYLRIYRAGDILTPHKDRPACEVSLSLCLGCDGEQPWPLWIEGPNGSTPVALAAGDGLLYRGMECRHWREPFPGSRAVQVFLHWVERHGPCAEWRFDKRPSLNVLPEHLKGMLLF